MPRGEIGDQAIARHDIEAGGGQHHDPRRARLRVPGRERFAHGDLAGDVHIVGAGLETRLEHRQRRPREGPGAVEHHIDVLQGRRDPGRVVQVERARLRRPAPGSPARSHGIAHRPELPRIAAGEHGPHAGLDRLGRDQPAGVAGRAVDHQLSFAHEPQETSPPAPRQVATGAAGPLLRSDVRARGCSRRGLRDGRWPRGAARQVILF